jgi:hypothetical protein
MCRASWSLTNFDHTTPRNGGSCRVWSIAHTRPQQPGSRQPIRRRERMMKRFKSTRPLQRFVSIHDPEEELDRIADIVDRPVEVHPLAPHLDIRLVNMPFSGHGAFAPIESFKQLRRKAEDPAMHRGMVNVDVALFPSFLPNRASSAHRHQRARPKSFLCEHPIRHRVARSQANI